MSFGFSVGDFIAVGKLTNDIISSLQAVGGAKSEYQELVRELQSLQTALRHLDRLDDTKSPAKHAESIKCAALACCYPLESFLTKIKKYEASLGLWSRMRTAKTVKDKLCWAFGEKGEIGRLRAYLSMHVETINNMLLQHGLERIDLLGKEVEGNTSQLQSQLDNTNTALDTIQKHSAGQAVMLRTMESMLGTLCKAVCGEITITLGNLSQAVTTRFDAADLHYGHRDPKFCNLHRYTLHILPAPYKFEDARGFVIPLPSEFSYEALENHILFSFREGAGAREVKDGNYELCNTKRRSERITAMSGLRPGLAITMAIMITNSADGDVESICPMPKCGSSNISPYFGGGSQCNECDVCFVKAGKKRRRDEECDAFISEDTEHPEHQKKRARRGQGNAVDSDETAGIRNVTWAAASVLAESAPNSTDDRSQLTQSDQTWTFSSDPPATSGMDDYPEEEFLPRRPPLPPYQPRATPSPSPPPAPSPSKLLRRQGKANRRKTRPTQGGWVLVREMAPNQPEIAQQISQLLYNSDSSDSAHEDAGVNDLDM